jgi:hypothetical protein
MTVLDQLQKAHESSDLVDQVANIRFQVDAEDISVAISSEGISEIDTSDTDLKLSISGEQLGKLCSGELSLSREYMRGDIKPEGSTSSILALCLLFG